MSIASTSLLLVRDDLSLLAHCMPFVEVTKIGKEGPHQGRGISRSNAAGHGVLNQGLLVGGWIFGNSGTRGAQGTTLNPNLFVPSFLPAQTSVAPTSLMPTHLFQLSKNRLRLRLRLNSDLHANQGPELFPVIGCMMKDLLINQSLGYSAGP